MSWIGTVNIEMSPGDDGQEWRTVAPLAYISDVDGPGEGEIIEVLPGMATDGASIPRLFWRLIGCPLRGRYAPAALIHDGLYAAQDLPRAIADRLFREMLLDLGLHPAKAWTMYQAVKLGGDPSWCNRTAGAIKAARQYVLIT